MSFRSFAFLMFRLVSSLVSFMMTCWCCSYTFKCLGCVLFRFITDFHVLFIVTNCSFLVIISSPYIIHLSPGLRYDSRSADCSAAQNFVVNWYYYSVNRWSVPTSRSGPQSLTPAGCARPDPWSAVCSLISKGFALIRRSLLRTFSKFITESCS